MTRESHRLLRVVDALAYALIVTAVVTVVGIGVALGRGGGWTTVREATFVLGVILVTIGTILTRPGVRPRVKRAEVEDDGRPELEPDEETPTARQERLASLVGSETPLTESDRFSRGGRLLLAGGLVLVGTFVTEYW